MSEESLRPGEKLRVLVVDKTPATAETVKDFLTARGFEIEECSFKKNPHKAIQTFVDSHYDYCFISDHFRADELESFFDDYENFNRVEVCLFFYLVEERKDDEAYAEIFKAGFHAVTSRKGTHQDFESVKEAEKKFGRIAEITRRKVDVTSAIDHLLKRVDEAASNIRRGVKHNLNKISGDFIEDQTDFDEEILDRYFNQLESKTEDSKPETVFEVEVPDEILVKNLPNLEGNRYKGVSHRVWEKIKKLHGVEGKGPQAGAEAAPEPVEEETSSVTMSDDEVAALLEEIGED